MIYDCFPFYNELMLLEIRLRELYPVVDKFVLVEATHTYSGEPKSLYYEQNKNSEIFAPFKDKIIHLVFDEKPTPPPTAANRWKYENTQRNTIKLGLTEAEPDDIIIVSDVDEIIKPEVFPLMEKIFVPGRLRMKFFYYYLNCRANRDWVFPAFCRFKDYRTAHYMRNSNGDYHKAFIINAGWHFGYLMTLEMIANKIAIAAHAEYDTDYYKNEDRLRKCIEANKDIFDRPNMNFSIEPLDAPECVMKNKDKYKDFIKDDSSRMLRLHTNIKE